MARSAASAASFTPFLRAYRPVSIDVPTLRRAVAAAPLEGTAQRGAPTILALPMPDGTTQRFQLIESPVMEPGLAAQFPAFRTYAGISLDDPTATLRCDITSLGFHAQVLSAVNGTVYIDPVSHTDQNHYISYYKRDIGAQAFANRDACGVRGSVPAPNGGPTPMGPIASRVQVSVGTQLRTLRTAVAATGEYTAAVGGGTVSGGQAAIVTAVNRVTGVYEKEIAVRLVLVANNSSLIFTNASTDPYTNDNASSLLSQNQTRIDATIGSANYDLGHVFSTGGGGLAGLGVVCTAGQKAQGETGSSAPSGDAFYIDYVAHEMGHQLGGNHTFNSSAGSCGGGNRNAGTAIEPGSGTTIMAYAGICGTDDVQPNSNAYFCYASYEEIRATLASKSCYSSAATGNTPPTVMIPAARSIPASTSFRLTAVGSDADGDALTYNWEDVDLGASVTLTAAQAAGAAYPLFRSFNATTSPTRYFPQLATLLANTTNTADKLPTVDRNLKFRCTVRDEHFSPALSRIVGGVDYSGIMTLTVVNTGAAFAVTAPNTAVALSGNTTVTWNVAGTTAAPISCATVNILLSTDGGLTYPTTLVNGVPNSGSAAVTLPNVTTSTARLMVAAADNYFFDISNANFSISPGNSMAPTISSFSPTSGAVGTSVTITGTNFAGATSVMFNGVAASFTVNSATSISTSAPVGATTGPISVTTPNGTVTSATSFTLPAPSTLSSFTPTTGPTGTSVTLTGTNFTGATAVAFAGTSATFTVVNATTITTAVPAGAASGTISVTTPLGTATSAATFTTTNPPANDLCTSPNLPVLACGSTVLGTTTNSTSTGDPTAACTTAVDAASGGVFYRFTGPGGAVTVTTCSASTAYDTKLFVFTGTCGALTCVVGNDDASCASNASTTTSTVTFTSVAGTGYYIFVSGFQGTRGDFALSATCTAPTLTSFTPATGPAGTSVSLTGTLLSTATAVQFNGTPAASFTVNSASSITAVVPAGATSGSISVTTGAGSATTSTSFTVIPAPTITSFSPASGPVGVSVVISGADFTGASGVTFNGTSAASFTVNSATQITATVPVGATTGTLTVTTSGGTVTSGTSFTVVPPPTITSFSPASGGVGTSVTLTGTNFTGTTSVLFNGTAATTFTVGSATSVTATVPAGATTGPISLATPSGTTTSAGSFTVVTGAPPTISSFTPASGVVGASMTLTGANFAGATAVAFNGAAATSFTINSATSITAVVPADGTTGKISVTTPNGTALSAALFKVLPTISSFTPASGGPGSVVTLTGTGFTGASAVKFYTRLATSYTVINSTTIHATVPPLALTGKLSVTTPGGTATSVATFTVAPSISSFTPGQGAPGSVVLVQGLNFTSTTNVAFNGLNAVKTYNSTIQITATVPAGATTGALTVSNSAGAYTSVESYTITSGPIPTITSFTPTTNVIAGTVVTITGANFIGATLVRFNNVNAASFTVLSATQVQAAVPAGALTGKVYVATPAGMAQSAASLTIIQPPTITSFSPTSGAPGSVVLLAGANLTGATSVTFNGLAAASYTVNSAAQIAAVVPMGATTGKLSVATIAGSVTSVASFTVLAGPAPTITALSPTSGPRGSTVVVTGTGFTGVTSVKVNMVAVGSFTVNSATQVTLTVPSTATTGRIYVTTSGGGMAQSPTNYTVILPPTITSFTPATGPVGTLVTINGANLTGASTVSFGGVAASSYTVVSAAKITATVPAGAITGNIAVTTIAGTAAKGTFTVTGPRAARAVVMAAAPVYVALYPNPATEWVGVEVLNAPAGSVTVEVLDGVGRVVRAVPLTDGYAKLTVTHLAPGLYVVRVAGQSHRLIVE